MADLKNFNKKWILSLADKPPAKRTEYKDTEYKYLRAIVQPSGHVSLSVYKAPRGHQRAVRRVLDIRVDEHMPPMSEVRSKAAELAKAIDGGEARKTEVITLEDGLRVMLSSAQLKPRTIEGYKRNVDTHLKDWKTKAMTGDAAVIVKKHRAITKVSGGVAANNAMRTYRRILNVCGASRLNVPVWPTAQLTVLKLWAPEPPRKRRVERNDFPAIWPALDDLEPMWGDLVRFWLLTGCRRREATNLTVGDVDLRRKTVTFADTKNKRDHTLPLTDTLLEILKRRKDAAGDDGLLFPCTEPKNITKHLARATGVHITPHDCRRTFAGVAELAGVGSHTVGVLLNHKSSTVTGGYIGQLDDTALRQALGKIEKRLLKLSKI